MSIEQIVASKLAGETPPHKHWFVMCGSCKEIFCPACKDVLHWRQNVFKDDIICPLCDITFKRSDVDRSIRKSIEEQASIDNPDIWNEYKPLKRTKGHGKLLKRGREIEMGPKWDRHGAGRLWSDEDDDDR